MPWPLNLPLRRRTLVVASGACATGAIVRAQVPGRAYRIGYLGYTASNTPDDERVVAAFRQRLREHGFVEGSNFTIEWRYAEGRSERYAEFAAELVRLGVEVVVVGSGTAARAVLAASRGMPIVTIAVPDPVRAGLVASLAYPGGQITGISNLADELVPKRLELLKAAVPAVTRIAIARCSRCQQAAGLGATEIAALLDEQLAAARALGVTLVPIDVKAAVELESVPAALKRERAGALLIGATPVNAALHDRWVALAAAERLPMLAPNRGFGAMLSYGPDYIAVFRRAADYVARILNGAKPADLPMEQPTRFEFVVNLGISKTIGITIPQAVLLRADAVIE